MICKNKRCMRPITGHYWGDGYCCERCFHDSVSRADGVADKDYLSDPTDPTGQRRIAETREEIEALLCAYDINPLLPRVLFLRRQGKTYAAIGKACHLSTAQCNRIKHRATRNILRAIGL